MVLLGLATVLAIMAVGTATAAAADGERIEVTATASAYEVEPGATVDISVTYDAYLAYDGSPWSFLEPGATACDLSGLGRYWDSPTSLVVGSSLAVYESRYEHTCRVAVTNDTTLTVTVTAIHLSGRTVTGSATVEITTVPPVIVTELDEKLSCDDLDPTLEQAKVKPKDKVKTKDLNGAEVVVDGTAAGVVSWTSPIPIDHVLVKTKAGWTQYTYPAGSVGDTYDLPVDKKGQPATAKELRFCAAP